MKGEKRIALCGYYGFGNVGDEATLSAAVAALRDLSPDCEITVFSQRPEETAQRLSCRAVPRMNPRVLLAEVRRCDALVFGGGSILQDVTGSKTLWYYLGLLKLAMLLGKETYLLSNGIGPLLRPASRKAVGRAVEKLTALSLRDEESASLLRSCGVKRELNISADLVMLSPFPEMASPVEGRYAAIAVRPWGDCDRLAEELARTLDGLSEEGITPVLVPFHPEYDRDFSRKIAAMTEHETLLFEPKSPEEAAAVVRGAAVVLAMRLHALIFAARAGVPAAGVVYDPKVESFLRLSGQAHCGTAETFSANSAISVLNKLMKEPQKQAFRTDLEKAGALNRGVIRQILHRKEETI